MLHRVYILTVEALGSRRVQAHATGYQNLSSLLKAQADV